MIAVTVVWTSLLLLWSLVVPLYDAPDEPQHVDMVLDAWDRPTWPGPTEKVYQPGWLDGLEELRFTTPDTGPIDRALDPAPANGAPVRHRSWDQLAAVGIPTDSLRNQMTQHPPLYYRLVRALLTLVPGWGSVPFDLLVWGLRLVSVALAAPLPWLVRRTADAAGLDRPQAALAMCGLLVLPSLAHISSVVTNDVLLNTLGAVGLAGTLRLLADPTGIRGGLLAGVGTAGAILVKAFGLALVPGLVVACAIALRRGGRSAVQPVVAALVPLVLAGLWYLENLIRYGQVQPQGFPVVARDGVDAALPVFAGEVARGLVVRVWGSVGWAEVEVGARPAAALSVLALVAVVVGAIRLRHRPAVLVVMLLPLAVVLGAVVGGAWTRFAASGELRGIQGRYLFIALPGLLVVAAAALRGRAAQVGVLTLALAGLAGHALLLDRVLTAFWAGPDRLASLAAWSPLGLIGPLLALTGVLAAALWTVVLLTRRAPRGGRWGEGA